MGQGGTVRTGDFILYMEKGNKNHQLGTGPQHRIKSVVNTVEFVSDMMSYVVLRGHWCDIIFIFECACSK